MKNLGYALPASNDQSENGGLGNQQISIFARKAPYHYGWDWGPRFVTSGIWRPIYLRAWDYFVIENVHFVQNSLTDDLQIFLPIVEVNSTIEGNVNLRIIYDGKEFVSKPCTLQKGNNIVSADFEIVNPKRWYPNGMGEHFQYNFISTLTNSNNF